MADMTHNVLFDKIAYVTRLLTKIRYQTVYNMAEMGKLQEMYDVHLSMYQFIKDKKQAAVDEIVRQGYFYEYGVLDEKER